MVSADPQVHGMTLGHPPRWPRPGTRPLLPPVRLPWSTSRLDRDRRRKEFVRGTSREVRFVADHADIDRPVRPYEELRADGVLLPPREDLAAFPVRQAD